MEIIYLSGSLDVNRMSGESNQRMNGSFGIYYLYMVVKELFQLHYFSTSYVLFIYSQNLVNSLISLYK